MDELRRRRKLEHIEAFMNTKPAETNGFDDITLWPEPMPSQKVGDADMRADFLGRIFSAPLLIDAVTGGAPETAAVNAAFASIARDYDLPMAVGSVKAALRDADVAGSYTVVRKENPDGFILANLGADSTGAEARAAVELLGANALEIHLNACQELVMPEGDRDFTGLYKNIKHIIASVNVPVVVKEVGFGLSREAVHRLYDLGIRTVITGGRGGTNFAAIESHRAGEATPFIDWGIPTPLSVAEARTVAPDLTVVATGGIRNGLDMAKAIALGADFAGISGPILRAFMTGGSEKLKACIDGILGAFQQSMVLLECKCIQDLKQRPLILSGSLGLMFQGRGFDLKQFGQR